MTARFQEYDLDLCKQFAEFATVIIVITKVDSMQPEERSDLRKTIIGMIKGCRNILLEPMEVAAKPSGP